MIRRLVVPVVAALLLSSPVVVGAQAAEPLALGEHAPSAKAKPKASKQSKACAARVKKKATKVASKKFAKCTIQATMRGRTVRITTAYDDGRRGTGPYRFGKTTDASVTSNDGTDLVALGKDFYVKGPDGGWVKGKANGNAAEQTAYATGALWRAMSSPAFYRKVLASSSDGWKRVGKARKVNGVKAIRYDGTPSVNGVVADRYSIWVDAQDRTIRVIHTTTAADVTVTMTQDWRKWGKKVTIKAPQVK